MTRRLAVFVFALAVVLACAACKKRAGAPCTDSVQVCADKTDALVCRGGTLTSIPCNGPLACSKLKERVSCDTTVANAGDNCMGDDEEYACSSDKKHAVVCKNGKFVPYLECRGPAGCAMNGRMISCDVSMAAAGDPCRKEDLLACSPDGQQMFVCRLGRFQSYRFCRGQFGCSIKADGPACDESLSDLGDPCGVPGQVVCARDGRTELICQGSTYTKSRTCKTSCTIVTTSGRHVDCK